MYLCAGVGIDERSIVSSVEQLTERLEQIIAVRAAALDVLLVLLVLARNKVDDSKI